MDERLMEAVRDAEESVKAKQRKIDDIKMQDDLKRFWAGLSGGKGTKVSDENRYKEEEERGRALFPNSPKLWHTTTIGDFDGKEETPPPEQSVMFPKSPELYSKASDRDDTPIEFYDTHGQTIGAATGAEMFPNSPGMTNANRFGDGARRAAADMRKALDEAG